MDAIRSGAVDFIVPDLFDTDRLLKAVKQI